MAINKIPKNYYSDTNIRRDKINEIIDEVNDIASIPSPSAADVGKVIKVNDSGNYGLSEDLHTSVIANPEGTPTAELNTVTIGDTIYKVNDVRVTKLLALRFTINNGGPYVTKMPIVSFVNEYGEAAQVPNYTMTCDKPLQYGDSKLNGDAGVRTENLPAIFTIVFNAEFNIDDFANIKLENSGLFPQDIAKNIKIEYSVNGTDWLEIFDKVSIDWTNTIHIYDMSSGEEITTKSPIPEPTTADAGKVLGVDNNGEWALDNIPSELPTVTSADAGKVLAVNNNGEWVAGNGTSNNRVEYFDVDYNSSPASYVLLNNKTAGDIRNSINNGNFPVCKIRNSSAPLFPLGLLYVTSISGGMVISTISSLGKLLSYQATNSSSAATFVLME